MRLADLGNITITVRPGEKGTEFEVRASERAEVIKDTVSLDERTDQFGQRLKGVLTALCNSPVKEKKHA